MSDPSISVILPVYNGEPYLARAIDSVLGQSFRDFELICVNDVSPDGSQRIINEYCGKDTRVKSIVHTVNKGHGPARNTGIRAARGEYLFHIDPDDTIPENALEILYSTAKRYGSDLVKGSYLHEYASGKKRHVTVAPGGEMVVNCNIHESEALQRIPSGHWTGLYAARVFKDVLYPEDVNFAYDMVFLCRAFIAAKNVTLINDCVYHYRYNSGSIMNTSVNLRKARGEFIWRRKAYEMLCEAGLEKAGRARYSSNAEYRYTHFWKPMPGSMSREEIIEFFDLIREFTDELGIYPWGDDTPLHIVAFLATVLAREDDKAIALLIDADAGEAESRAFMDATAAASLKARCDELNGIYSSRIWRLMRFFGLVREQGG